MMVVTMAMIWANRKQNHCQWTWSRCEDATTVPTTNHICCANGDATTTYHHHGVQSNGQNARVQADAQHDQLHQTARVHQKTQCHAGAPRLTRCPPCHQARGQELRQARQHNDEHQHAQVADALQRRDVHLQAGVGKVQRQQEVDDDQLNARRQLQREVAFFGDDEAGEEGTEERVDANGLWDSERRWGATRQGEAVTTTDETSSS
jgi:hypothetical protein